MNYALIKSAQKQLTKVENEYLNWRERVALRLHSLTEADVSEEERKRTCDGLLERTGHIIKEVEEMLDSLGEARFSESESFLREENIYLIQQYQGLMEKLKKVKGAISRQSGKEVMVVTPLQQKNVKIGYCYFCDVSIADNFAYKLSKREQNTLGIELAEGTAFCSQKCLWSHREEYKKREELRQKEREKIENKVERDRKKVTEIQGQITDLTERINKLQKREWELELSPENSQVEKPENAGFFRRLGRKLGLVKKPNPLSKIERIRKLKEELNVQLEKNEEKLKTALIVLSLDEQKEEERKRLERKALLEKNKFSTNKNISDEEEEVFD
jgi:hypothetical protein